MFDSAVDGLDGAVSDMAVIEDSKDVDAALPLASGWGVEVGMTIDLLVKGFTVQEIPCELAHRVSTNDFAGNVHRAKQYLGVLKAVWLRRLRGVRMPHNKRHGEASVDYQPFNAFHAYPSRHF